MTVNGAAFDAVGALLLLAALATVVLPSPHHSVYALAASEALLAVLLLVLGADLTAAVVLLAGAVATPLLLLSVLAAAGERPERGHTPWVGGWPAAAVVAALATAGLVAAAIAGRGDVRVAAWPSDVADGGAAATIARSLLGQSILPFMGLAVLLLTALVGAVVVGGRDERELELEKAERQRRERAERGRRRREDRARARARLEGQPRIEEES